MGDSSLRILMFAPNFAPSANPEALVNNKLVIAMKEQNWHIDVVSRQFCGKVQLDYGSDWVSPWKSLQENVYPVQYVGGQKLRSSKDVFYSIYQFGHIVRGMKTSPIELQIAMNLHKQNQYDIVISRALPDVAHLPALYMAQQTGLPWIANWNDPPLSKFPEPYENKKNNIIISCSQDRFINDVIKKADALTFCSPRLLNYACKNWGAEIKNKCIAIPHIAMKSEKLPEISKNERNTVFTLCYAGNLFPPRSADFLLRSLASLSNLLNNSKWFSLKIIGIMDEEYKKLAGDLNIAANIEYLGKVSYHNTLEQLGRSDVQVLIEAPCEEGVFLPSKLVDYIQAGRPILAISPQNGSISDIISEYGGGIAANCCSEKSIVKALEELYVAWQKETLDSIYSSRRLFSFFDPRNIIAQYKSLFSDLGVFIR